MQDSRKTEKRKYNLLQFKGMASTKNGTSTELLSNKTVFIQSTFLAKFTDEALLTKTFKRVTLVVWKTGTSVLTW